MDLTPAMQQYVKIKREYPKSLLLFRMGDFYESFFEDAKEISSILNITLTKRGTKHAVPLAGIPYHALETYLNKLVKAGKTVTIIEQMEDPKLAKGRLVKRDVLRTITPGTVIEGTFLDAKTNNYILSIYFGKKIGIAFTDVSTGEFKVFETRDDELLNDIVKINPSEILVLDDLNNNLFDTIKRVVKSTITEQPIIYFNKTFGEEEIKEHFNVLSLSAFDLENKDEIICATGCLLNYLKYTQKTRLKHINKIQYFNNKDFMSFDIHTIKNLELVENLQGGKTNTLLETIDFTQTAMGARLLKKNLLLPLLRKGEIEKRQNTVEFILKKEQFVDLENNLRGFPDLERIIARIMYGTSTPRELNALRDSILKSRALFDYTNLLKQEELTFETKQEILDLANTISTAIVEDPPAMFKEGGFIRKGFNSELDELLNLKSNSKQILLQIEQKEKERTGIKTLRVGYNKVFGYFIEIPKSQHQSAPNDYIRKQTLANNERYITEELKQLEDKILGAEEKTKALELELFNALVETIKTYFNEIDAIAKAVANIDFYNSLATCAHKRNYSKPELTETGTLNIVDGRHPVVELIEQEKYIKNDLEMDTEKNNVIILTGPNMSGKSTYLRQNALIILLAHLGSYVPARSAKIPITDRIFTRIGAHDNLALGLSTFMVEMIETANILNNATERSFIILDEVGRGTSTYDGLSIAWAVLEYIYTKIGAKTLFATHYHQITDLEYKYSGIKNYYITAKELDNNIIFLRKVVKGSIDRSYGIAVAKLAGLPQEVIDNALQIEKELENNKIEKKNIERITVRSAVGQKTLLGEKNDK